MKVLIEIPDNEIPEYLRRAIVLGGFKREYPEKAWTVKEQKEAIRYYINEAIR